MYIKIFADSKEIIAPLFEVDNNNEERILGLCIKNFSNDKQDDFLSIIKNLKNDNLYINSDYIAITTNKEIYFFSLDNYKDYKLENAIVSGHYDLMFAFVDQNDMIIDKEYFVMKLNGLQFKKL